VTAPGRDGAAATREFEALALPPYSPGGSVTGELVDVGYGTPAEIDEREVEGRIAVASTTTPEGGRFVHRMEKFGYALDAGAVGFVFVNHLDGQLPPPDPLTFGEGPRPSPSASRRRPARGSGVRGRRGRRGRRRIEPRCAGRAVGDGDDRAGREPERSRSRGTGHRRAAPPARALRRPRHRGGRAR